MICDTVDYAYPLLADIYYPRITQGLYNEVKKEWIFDKTIPLYAVSYSGRNKQELGTEAYLQYEKDLLGRSRTDIRFSSQEQANADTNILITNIRNNNKELVYKETSGPRSGKGTIYEIATIEPFVGLFGDIEYYNFVLRRTENQDVGE